MGFATVPLTRVDHAFFIGCGSPSCEEGVQMTLFTKKEIYIYFPLVFLTKESNAYTINLQKVH